MCSIPCACRVSRARRRWQVPDLCYIVRCFSNLPEIVERTPESIFALRDIGEIKMIRILERECSQKLVIRDGVCLAIGCCIHTAGGA